MSDSDLSEFEVNVASPPFSPDYNPVSPASNPGSPEFNPAGSPEFNPGSPLYGSPIRSPPHPRSE